MSYNKEYAQKWRDSNREKMREYHRIYQRQIRANRTVAEKKKVQEQNKLYKLKNKEILREKMRLTDIEQQKKAFHYTNLQPLWAKENLIKSNNI